MKRIIIFCAAILVIGLIFIKNSKNQNIKDKPILETKSSTVWERESYAGVPYANNSLTFHGINNIEICRIAFDGTVWVNPNVPLPEIAKEMFRIIGDISRHELDDCKEENQKLKNKMEISKRAKTISGNK